MCSDGPGHMTNMAVMPGDSKRIKKSPTLEPMGRWP